MELPIQERESQISVGKFASVDVTDASWPNSARSIAELSLSLSFCVPAFNVSLPKGK